MRVPKVNLRVPIRVVLAGREKNSKSLVNGGSENGGVLIYLGLKPENLKKSTFIRMHDHRKAQKNYLFTKTLIARKPLIRARSNHQRL